MSELEEWIAIHEAGHAVVCWWVGGWFEYVSIERWRMDAAHPAGHLREDADARIMYILAGPVAEEAFAGDRPLPADSIAAADNDEAAALYYYHADDRDNRVIDCGQIDPRCGLTAGELIKTLRSLTRDLLRHPTVWAAVEAVAKELLQRDPLDYNDVSALATRAGLTQEEPRGLGPWFPKN